MFEVEVTSEKGNLSIMNRITCPKSYVIQRFHCIMIVYNYVVWKSTRIILCATAQCNAGPPGGHQYSSGGTHLSDKGL